MHSSRREPGKRRFGMTQDYWKQLKTPDAVQLFCQMVDLRSYYATPDEPVSMTEVWEDMASTEFEDSDEFKTKIKMFSGEEKHNRKAGVVAFASQISLIVSKGFWELARKGERFRNFLLAHEFVHIVRDHHAHGAVVKHFQLDSRTGVNSNIPPTWEEFETNVGAVLFQCGTALFEKDRTAFEIAQKFRTDPYYVERLQRLCQSRVFLDEYERQTSPKPRVVL